MTRPLTCCRNRQGFKTALRGLEEGQARIMTRLDALEKILIGREAHR
jgi:hypothetical protein